MDIGNEGTKNSLTSADWKLKALKRGKEAKALIKGFGNSQQVAICGR